MTSWNPNPEASVFTPKGATNDQYASYHPYPPYPYPYPVTHSIPRSAPGPKLRAAAAEFKYEPKKLRPDASPFEPTSTNEEALPVKDEPTVQSKSPEPAVESKPKVEPKEKKEIKQAVVLQKVQEDKKYSKEFLLRFKTVCEEPLEGVVDHGAILDTKVRNKRRDRDRDGGGGAKAWRTEEVKLEKSANAYVVKRDLGKEEKILRAYTSLLNKASPENVEQLAERCKNEVVGGVSNEEMLKSLVNLTVEQALSQPIFSPSYAHFALLIHPSLPTFPSTEVDEQGKPKEHSFRRHLLLRMQSEFNREKNPSLVKKGSTSNPATPVPDLDSPTTPSPGAEKPADKEEDPRAAKTRLLGAIRFIGELFVRKLLVRSIIEYCIHRLLLGPGVSLTKNEPDDALARFAESQNLTNLPPEEDLEALVQLLGTVGADVDKSNKKLCDYLFQSLTGLTKSSLPARLRFLIQDVIDSRAKGWPKKDPPKKKKTKSSSSMGPPAAKLGKGSQRALDPSKAPKDKYSLPTPMQTPIKSNQPSASKNRDRYTPDVRGKTGSSSTSKSATKGKNAEEDNPKKTLFIQNAFQALGNTDDEAEGDDEEKEDDGEGEGDVEVEAEPGSADLEAEPGRASEGANSAAQRGEEGEEAEEEDPVVAQFKKKASALLQEFFSSSEVEEARRCFRELQFPSRPSFVSQALVHVVEQKRDEKLRVDLAKFLAFLQSHKDMTSEDLAQGVLKFLALVGDLQVDNPMCVADCGDIVARLVHAGALDLAAFRKNHESFKHTGLPVIEKLIGNMLNSLQSLGAGLEEAQGRIEKAKFNARVFLKDNTDEGVQKFIARYELKLKI